MKTIRGDVNWYLVVLTCIFLISNYLLKIRGTKVEIIVPSP